MPLQPDTNIQKVSKTLNPCLVAQDDSAIVLAKLLQQMRPGTIFKKNGSISVLIGNKNYIVRLTHDIICRPSEPIKKFAEEESKLEFLYEVIGNTPLGNGNFAQVFPVEITLMLINHVIKKKEGEKNIVKIEKVDRYNTANLAKKEALIGSELTYLQMKPLLTIKLNEEEKINYIFMRRMPGKSLREHLKSGRLAQLNSEEILTFFLTLLSSLELIHSKGIVHRDIKAENIMVHFGEEKLTTEVNIVDFGHSRKEGEADILCGSNESIITLYEDERIYKEFDIFFMGKVFDEILTAASHQKKLLQILPPIIDQMLLSPNLRISLNEVSEKIRNIYIDLVKPSDLLNLSHKIKLLIILGENKSLKSSEKIAFFTRHELQEINKELKTNLNQLIAGIDIFISKEDIIAMETLLIDELEKLENPKVRNIVISCFEQSNQEKESLVDNRINLLRQSIHEAICIYIQLYGISEKRLKNIKDLLNCLEISQTSQELQLLIKKWSKTIEKGILGRSQLQDFVEIAVSLKSNSIADRLLFWKTPSSQILEESISDTFYLRSRNT
ncbi:MAG: protein kinase [Pseudomonadota bacterium]